MADRTGKRVPFPKTRTRLVAPEGLASSLPPVEQLEAELAADVWEDES